MSYLVFARKFRPQTFAEVIGQEPITTTLKNAIAKGRIAQSFLFTGSRGVGKTSTARIFAKALNCEKGPAPEPCNKCATCEEITRGSSLDILEIDGASNRGIDEIRNLRENVKFKPAHGRYKVYIIDEVHQITHDGFNALLKTLEEPPEHVKFIFATTEAHKVPLTILSRCQRFNFRRIPTEEIAQKLAEIAKAEKIKATRESLFIIAKAAEGSLRDAESLLDQLASFTNGEIKEADIVFSLGLTEEELYFKLLEALKTRDAKGALQIVHEITESGKDLTQFSRGLLELFRDLLVSQLGAAGEKLIEGTEEWKKSLAKFQSTFTREELLFSLTLIQQLVRELRWSNVPKFLIEAAILKIVHRADLKPIDDVIKELKGLEAKFPVTAVPAVKSAPPPAPPPQAPKKKDHPEIAIPTEIRTLENEQARSVAPKGEPITLGEVERIWPDLLERVKAIKMSCGTYLAEAEPVEVADGLVVFGFPNDLKFHKESLEKQDHRDLIRNTLVALLGRDARVSFVITAADKTVQQVPQATAIPDSEIITSALNIFSGGKIIRREN